MDRVGRAVRVDLDQGDHDERRQRDDLETQEERLDASGELDAAVADPRHQNDPDHRTDDQDSRVGMAVKEQERVLARDHRQRRHHDDVRQEDRPAVDPPKLRAECARDPSKRGAGVGVREVEEPIADGDEQHRNERHEQHGGRVRADAGDCHDEPERGGEAVSGRHRSGRDDQVLDVADRVALEPLGARGGGVGRDRRFDRDGCALHCGDKATVAEANLQDAQASQSVHVFVQIV